MPLLVIKIATQFFVPPLLKRVSDAHVFMGLLAVSAAALVVLVNWRDFATAVDAPAVVVGMILIGVDAFSVSLHTSLLSQKVPPELQLKIQTRNGVLGQLGRAVMPIVGTSIYAALSAAGLGIAFNGVCFASGLALNLGHLLGLANFRAIYGSVTASPTML